jgi:hypothetical protein
MYANFLVLDIAANALSCMMVERGLTIQKQQTWVRRNRR